MPEPLLSRRTVVLAKIESSFNTDAVPTAALDAILVAEADYTTDVNILERDFTRNDIDRLASRAGRKIGGMKFRHEWRSNGKTNSGVSGDACKLGRLLRGCGFAQTAVSVGTAQIGAINADPDNTGPTISWATAGAGAAGLTQPARFVFEVTTAGASGTAKFSITPDTQSVAASVQTARTDVTATSGTAIDLVTGLTIAPTWTGNLVLGDKFYVWIFPVGFVYLPVSNGFESLTLYMYKDGNLHKMTGCQGNFSMQGEAGGYASAEFTFTGQYVTPTAAALPANPVFEKALPAIVELSDLYLGSHRTVASMFSLDVGNTITPRTDANAAEGYDGVRITRRNVSGAVDPEVVVVSTFNFWDVMANATNLLFRTKVGQVAGNRIWALGPQVQLGAVSYKDREEIQALDIPLMFNRHFGNDSLMVCVS